MPAKNADLEAPLLQSAAVPSEARFDATFREMQLRKLRRVLHVLRSQQGMCRLGWVLAYVGALTAALLAASMADSACSRRGPMKSTLHWVSAAIALCDASRSSAACTSLSAWPLRKNGTHNSRMVSKFSSIVGHRAQ